MKRVLAIAVQIVAAIVLWALVVLVWKAHLPFYTDYGDMSRIEAKGYAIAAVLFLCSHYLMYRLRRRLCD